MIFSTKVSESFNQIDSTTQFDVCIIGSGPAGTVLGVNLVKAGIKTVIVESGTDLSSWLTDKNVRHLAGFEVTGNADYPVSNTRAKILGGTSNFWTGRCERFHPSDFEPHPYTPPDNPWPVTYQELDPYYDKAEESLRVRGSQRSEYTPPKKGPFPLENKLDISYLKNLFGNIGVTVDDSPTATPRKSLRFFKVQKEILPEFLKSPNAVLVTGVTITKLITNADKHIIGAEAKTFNGSVKTINAKIFVLAGGGIETPRMLLFSKSEFFPEGIGNAYNRVGKGFNEHPAVNFYAQIKHSAGTIYPSNKIGRSHQFYTRYRKDGLGSVLPVFRQSWILPHHNMPFTLANIPRNTLAVLKRFLKATLYIGVVTEMKISDTNCVTLSKTRKDPFGNPMAHLHLSYSDEDLLLLEKSRELVYDLYKKVGAENIHEAQITFSRHHQGTCRMGNNPKTSVVDKNLKVHDTKNLYLGGSEVFVTGGSMQPVLTIVALAHRLSEHLISKFKDGSINNS
jgi:glucose dehydrogenase